MTDSRLPTFGKSIEPPPSSHQCAGDRRILHVISHLKKGGAERQLRFLLEASQHQNFVIALHGTELVDPKKVFQLPDLKFQTVFDATRLVIEQKAIEIVQLWLPERVTIPALIAARRANVGIISCDRRRPRNIGLSAIRDRLKYVSHGFSHMIVQNYPILQGRVSLQRLLNFASKTRVIPNGIVFPTNPPKLRRSPDRLLFVGRLVHHKRVDVIVQALPRLIATTPIRSLLIVGDGPEYAKLGELARSLGIEDRVEFTGEVHNWQARCCNEDFLFVLPSESEGMSNSLLEAVAHGFMIAVNTTQETIAVLQMVGIEAGMFKTKKLDTLIDCCRKLTSHSLSQKATIIARNHIALSEYSVERMAAQYDSIYSDSSWSSLNLAQIFR